MELVGELESIDKKMKAAEKDLTALVQERGSSLLELNGIGPSGAARLLVDVGDIHRFRDKDRFASWNGTAPLDASSGNQQRHRLSRAGNRRINRTLHIMAVVQLRNPTAGRVFYDARKAGGTPSMMAMRGLKRRLSNIVFARMAADQAAHEQLRRETTTTTGRTTDGARATSPGGHSGHGSDSSATGSHPTTGSSLCTREPVLVWLPLEGRGGSSRVRMLAWVGLTPRHFRRRLRVAVLHPTCRPARLTILCGRAGRHVLIGV